MATRSPSSQAGTVDLLVGLLSEINDAEDNREYYDRICETLCRLTSLERATLLLYDRARYVATAAGSHGLDRSLLGQVEASLEEAPVAQRALAEDRVVEVSGDLEKQLPPRYAEFAGITTLVCAPVAAGGNWFGVIFADTGGGRFTLSAEDQQTALSLGRLAALAATVERSTRQHERAQRLDERIALAREVHEQVIQRLFGLSLALGSDEPLSATERERCGEEVRAVLGELRLVLGRPLGPQEPETKTTLRDLLAHKARISDLELSWPQGEEVPPHLEPLAQSVVTEALRNVERHAPESTARVRVGSTRDAFELEVTNDGARSGPRGAGVGLRLLTLEALQHNGLIEFGSGGKDGWRVRLIVPVHDQDE